jgi:hypothetical protein
MPEAVLAIFGGWMLASIIAGALFVTVKSRLKNRPARSVGQQAPVQIVTRGPAGTAGELDLVGDTRQHARR